MSQFITVDIGNTSIKCAIFSDYRIEKIERFSDQRSLVKFLKHQNTTGIISSVADIDDDLKTLTDNDSQYLYLEHLLNPIASEYDLTTIGQDRLASILGCRFLFPNTASIIIDIGTCITYDYITNENIHLGGAISPGFHLRYKALNTFTSKLPLYSSVKTQNEIGLNTQQAIESGVVNGIIGELKQRILDFKQKETKLQVIFCGGDSEFVFHTYFKEAIYEPNLIHYGLMSILKENASNI